MSASEFAQIASFAAAAEAQQMRSMLAESGIAAFVDRANATTVLSHIGSALGGVRLLVRVSDAHEATQIMESLRDESDVSGTAWFCGKCQEEVEAGFQVCWSCGGARMDVEQPFPPIACGKPSALEGEHPSGVNVRSRDVAGYDPSNPYAAPLSPFAFVKPDETRDTIDADIEDMLLRAWRAAIIGIVCLPILTHLYSMYLLVRAATFRTPFSPIGRQRFYRAFAVNVVAGATWGMLFSALSQ